MMMQNQFYGGMIYNQNINQMNMPFMYMNNMMIQNMNPMNYQMMNMMNNNTMQWDNENSNIVFNDIIHKDPINDERLTKSQKNLSLFFNGITNFNKNIQKIGSKIIINYYNLEKVELYLDLDLKIKDLISIIFGSILFCSEPFKIYKRTKKDQTTEHIINNPIINQKENKDIIISKETFILEYKNNNLLDLSEKTGNKIGLKNDEEILLKLNENFYKDLISLPLDGTYLKFYFNLYKNFLFGLPTFIGESAIDLKKRLSSIFEKEIDYNSIAYPFPSDSEAVSDAINIYNFGFQFCGIVKGGKFIKFANVEKNKIKELKFSKSAPSWRAAEEGLNIFGICDNNKCKAFKKEVVYIPQMEEHKFDIIENITNIICPECKRIISPKTCGFWKCEYQFKGKKIEKGLLREFDSKPKETKDNKFEYFDPSNNGIVRWTELIIYVLPKQKIKYMPN